MSKYLLVWVLFVFLNLLVVLVGLLLGVVVLGVSLFLLSQEEVAYLTW